MGYDGKVVAAGSHRPLAGPLYRQIHEHLRERIAAGEWTSEVMLPNEVDFAREYGVSIGTMRKALDRLGQARLIVRRQGRGTYVRRRATDPLTRFSRWDVKDFDASRTSERVLTAKLVRLSPAEAQRLGSAKGETVLKIETLGSVGADCRVLNSYALARRAYDGSSATAPDTAEKILDKIVQATTRATRCVDRVTPAKADAIQAAKLGISDGDPVLRIARVGLDGDGRPLFICDGIAHIANGIAYSADLD